MLLNYNKISKTVKRKYCYCSLKYPSLSEFEFYKLIKKHLPMYFRSFKIATSTSYEEEETSL